MAILVKAIQRVNPKDLDAPRKWYVTQVTTNQADETEVAMDISEETTLNPSEAILNRRMRFNLPHQHIFLRYVSTNM